MGPKRSAEAAYAVRSGPWADVKVEKGRVVGKHGRVWRTVNIPQEPKMLMIRLIPRYGAISHKKLHIVQQDQDMNLHINPDPSGPDFWEKPAGSGSGDWIGTPLDRTSIKKKTQSPATEGEPALKVLKKDPESGYNSGSIWVPESGYSSGSYWVPESGYGSESSWAYISTEAATAATATTAAATDQSKENEEAMVTATGMN